MNRYVMEEFYNDPALRRRLFAEAHRDRARAVSAGLSWLFGAVAWLFAQVVARLKPRHPARWIERLG